MKKLYSFMLVMATAAAMYTADAKTFTIVVDDASRVVVRDPSNGYDPVTFTNNSVTVTDENDSFFPVQANSGYEIMSATDSGSGLNVTGEYTTFPTESCQLYSSDITDGGTVTITTREAVIPTYTILAEDVSILNVQYNYQTYTPEGDRIVVPFTSKYATLSISIASNKSDEYAILSATSDDGTVYTPSYGTISIYNSTMSEDRTLTVETVNLAEVRTATMNVIVDGSPSAVKLVRSDNSEIYLSGENTPVKFDPKNEASFRIESAVYGKHLYKVELDGTPVAAQGSIYRVTATDGCTLKITTDYPDVDVPVSFSFAKEGIEGVIRSVRVNNVNATDWNEAGYTVKLGATLNIDFNTSDYTDINISLNGSPVNVYSSLNYVVEEEQPLEFVISAEKALPYYVTFITDTPDFIKVYNGYGYNESELLTLTGEETVLEIPKSYSYITVKPAEGYMIQELVDGNGNNLSVGYSNYISGDMEIFAVAAPIERNLSFTFYLHPGTWNYRSVVLSQSNYDLRKAYTDADLPIGYSTIAFGDFDLPINISGYPTPVIYRNDEVVELNYGALPETADGDVIKMYLNTPESYGVTYDIDENVNVEVRHDHTTLIASPSSHTVLEGTEIVITAVADESPVARVAENTGAPVVTVNGTTVTPDSEGRYVIAVNSDSAIKVTPGETVGIGNIDATLGNPEAPVYNLQGILVGNASKLRALPAGTYIIGGRKVRI